MRIEGLALPFPATPGFRETGHGSKVSVGRGQAKEISMEMRVFGRSGLELSTLGFGCGAVGGLMVRGAPADQERTIGKALAAGVNYFDTAVQYGNGASERNLGRTLKALKAKDVVIGTKVGFKPEEMTGIGEAVTRSLEGSLERLGMERVDIFHLHNPITAAR